MGSHSNSLNALAFLGLKSRPELAGWLGLTDRKLCYLLYVLDASKKYNVFQVAKKKGA